MDGYVVTVKDAASRVGETVPIRIENVTKTTARAVIAEGENVNGDDPTKEKPKKKTRRGTRGGRGRKKKTEAVAKTDATAEPAEGRTADEPAAEAPRAEAPSENGEEPKPKKKTRRGTRGGRGRKRKPVESPPEAGQESPLA